MIVLLNETKIYFPEQNTKYTQGNFFEIFLNQTEMRLYLEFSD